jgi:hypothetical protein
MGLKSRHGRPSGGCLLPDPRSTGICEDTFLSLSGRSRKRAPPPRTLGMHPEKRLEKPRCFISRGGCRQPDPRDIRRPHPSPRTPFFLRWCPLRSRGSGAGGEGGRSSLRYKNLNHIETATKSEDPTSFHEFLKYPDLAGAQSCLLHVSTKSYSFVLTLPTTTATSNHPQLTRPPCTKTVARLAASVSKVEAATISLHSRRSKGYLYRIR